MTDDERLAADNLAGGVRDFLSSLSYVAPEALGLHVRVKLLEPLEEWETVTADEQRSE